MTNTSYPLAIICVDNDGNEVSLQRWKIYKPLRDDDARSEGFYRVVDESGEDYLFPEQNFVPIELPAAARKPFERAARAQRRAASAQSSPSAKRARITTDMKASKRRQQRRA